MNSFLTKFILVTIMVFLYYSGFNQSVTLVVKDKTTDLVLEGATIYINDSIYITDRQGALITQKRNDSIRITISYIGYKTLQFQGLLKSPMMLFYLENEDQIKSTIEIIGRAADRSPVTKQTISINELKTHLPVDIPLLLEQMPNTVATSDAGNGIGYSALRIRGSDQTRINVMIDGVPVNDAESQNVFWVDLPNLIEDVEDIQVQRGIGISTMGPGAFGANVNIITGELSKNQQVSGQIGVGSFGSQKFNVSYQSGKINNLKFKVRGSHIRSDGYIDRASSNLWAGSFQSNYSTKKLFIAANTYWGKEKTYQAWNGVPYYYAKDKNLRKFNSAGLMDDGNFYQDETDNYIQIYSRLIANYFLNNKSSIQATLYHTFGKGFYNNYKSESLSNYFSDEIGDVELIRQKWLKNNLFGINLLYQYKLNHWKNKIGFNVQQYEGNHFGKVTEIFNLPNWKSKNYYDTDAQKNEQSIFINSQRQWDKWTGMIDVQLRNISYNYVGLNTEFIPTTITQKSLFFNPKFGISYLQNGLWYAYVGQAHKEPNRDDFVDAAPNKSPLPEKMINTELGYEKVGNKFSIGINLFGMWYKDQLVLTGKINDVGAYTRFNVPDSRRMGIEMQGKWQVIDKITFHTNFSLSTNKIKNFVEFIDDSELINGDIIYRDQIAINHGTTDIAFSPNVISYFSVNFFPFKNKWKRNELELLYDLKFVGQQYLDNTSNPNSRIPAYLIHGFEIRWKGGINKNIELFTRVNNLTNHLYSNNGWIYRYNAVGYDPSQGDPYTLNEGENKYSSIGLYPQAGINFYCGIKFKFGLK